MADASPTAPSITASAKWVAAGVGENKGNVGIYPVNFAQYQKKADAPVIGAHTGPLADLAFSTFNADLLATAGKDGLVKLWNVPSDGLKDSTLSASATWGEFEGLTSLAWHPTADGILAAGGRKSLNIFDAQDTKTPKYSFSLEGFNKDINHVAWNYNGSQLAAVGKNNVVHLLDPRSADSKTAIDGAGNALGDLKPQCALFVGNTTYSLLLLGLDKMRNPMYSFYDTRSMGKVVDTKSLSFSTGFLIPLYDIDTELLMIGVRGSSQLSFFDMSQGALDACGQYNFKSGLKGAAMTRKQGVDIYNQEVNRIFGLTDKTIEPAAMTVPRKSPGFHIELYPPTAEVTPTMTADAWLKGANEQPKLYQITDTIADAKQAKVAEVVEAKQQAAVAAKVEARTYKATTTRQALEGVFANSVFKHTKGAEPNSKDLMYYMLQTFGKTLNLSKNIRANPTNFAFPWKTVGGSALCVVPLTRLGRCADMPPLVRGHKSQFNCFDLSQFDHNLVVTGGDEGKALVYRLPEGGQKDDIEKPNYEIETEGKVGVARFHPYAADIVITASTNPMTGTAVQFWPLGADVKPAPKLSLPNHKEPVWDVQVSPDGFTVATTSRDAKTRLFDCKDGGKMVSEFEPPEGQRDTQVVWINTHTLITLGFGKMSKRTMSLWDTKTGDFKNPIKTVELSSSNAAPLAHYDEDSCILFIANHGGRIMSTYNVTPKTSPYIDQLSEWMTASDMIGWAFLPKTVCDVKKVEIARCLKLTKDSVVPVNFLVPRKRMEYFQDDIFVNTRSPDAWFTADEWFSGSAKEQQYVTMQPAGMLELSKAPKEELTEAQKKYQNHLEAAAKAKEAQLKGATGHSSSKEVQKYFSQVATTMPSKNRWDAQVDNSHTDVDDSEW